MFTIRKRRINLTLPIELFLQSKRRDVVSSESSCGIMSSLSQNGACIICNKVMLDGKHVFFTAQMGAESYILLNGLPDECPVSSVPAAAVWMDSCIHEDKPSFKIGISFLHEQKQLFSFLKSHYQ